MTLTHAILLGLLQGFAEFLPISSSAHLTLAPWVFGWPDPGLAVDVALHSGTLLAVLWYFRRELWELLASGWTVALPRRVQTEAQRRFLFLVIAAIPGG